MTLTQINKAGLDEIALDHVFTIGASGSSAYTFQGEGLNGTVNNPTLYLTRGKTYRFENGSGGHPIRIQSTSGASGTAYNTGVTNNAGSGTVIVEVQHDAPDVLYYQCTSHAAMNGILYITGALADGGVTTAKIAANAVTEVKIVDGAIRNSKVDSAANIDGSKLANDSISLAKLEHGTSSNDGKFLRANNGTDPSFETVTSTTINNNADNRVITGSGTANTLEGEANLTFTGHQLGVTDGNGTTTVGGNYALLKRTSGNTNYINAPLADADLVISADENLLFQTVHTADFNSTERMRIDSSGRVGIGVTSPITPLHVKHATTNGVATFESGDATCLINFKDNSTTDSPSLGAEANNFKLITSGTERIRITSSGNVGVGTPSPSTTLSVINNSNTEGFNVKHSNLTQGVGIGYDHVKSTGSSTNVPLHLRAKGSGGVRIGYDSTTKVHIDSDGLKFNGDTAAANALDDYEEGTWTPRLGGTSNYSSYNMAGSGWYCKIGRIVHFMIRFNNQNLNNSASGGVMIYQFPYNFSNGGASNASGCAIPGPSGGHFLTFTGTQDHLWYGNNNNNIMYGLVLRSAASWIDWPVSDFHSSDFYFMMSGAYLATS